MRHMGSAQAIGGKGGSFLGWGQLREYLLGFRRGEGPGNFVLSIWPLGPNSVPLIKHI